MSTVIKAGTARHGSQATAFNFDDLSQQAQAYLDQVRVEAQKIVHEAQQQAKVIRQQAEIEGRADGQQAVEQLTAAHVAKQMETVLPALRQAISGLEQARQEWLATWEKQAVHVAAAMAACVIRREVSRQPEITLTLVREALQLAAGNPHVELHVHPADHEVLAGGLERLTQEFSRLSQVTLVADATLTRGGCRLQTRHGVIDQQIEAQLARIEAEIS
jgi:flagellar assembly protein FliH